MNTNRHRWAWVLAIAVATALAVTACSEDDSSEPAAVIEPSEQATASPARSRESALNGTYRTRHDPGALLERGIEKRDLDEYAGLHTMQLDDGHLVDSGDPSTMTGPPCEGSYQASDDDRVSFFLEVNCSGSFTATWSLEGDQLHLRDVESSGTAKDKVIFEAVWGTDPFIKIE